jgi:hypothetical protein
MEVIFKVRLEDLDGSFIEKVGALFKKGPLEIRISDELDETEYLLSTPGNRAFLRRSLAQLANGEVVSKNVEELEQ